MWQLKPFFIQVCIVIQGFFFIFSFHLFGLFGWIARDLNEHFWGLFGLGVNSNKHIILLVVPLFYGRLWVFGDSFLIL